MLFHFRNSHKQRHQPQTMQQKVEAKKGNRWYPEDDVMKVDPKALGLATWRDQLADFFWGLVFIKKMT